MERKAALCIRLLKIRERCIIVLWKKNDLMVSFLYFVEGGVAHLAVGKLQDGEGGLVCVPDEGCWRGGAFV